MNKQQIAHKLTERNLSGIGIPKEEFEEMLINNYTAKELKDTKELKPCSACGGNMVMKSFEDENGKILYYPSCLKCNGDMEMYYTPELAIFSHNTDSWFNDGIED